MQCTVDCETLRKHLKFVNTFVGRNSSTQIYHLMYLSVENKQMELRAMGDSIYAITSLPAEVNKPGTVLLDPDLLTSNISTLQPGTIKFNVGYTAKNTKLHIQQGKCKRQLQTGDSANFPDIPHTEADTVMELSLSRLLGSTQSIAFARFLGSNYRLLEGICFEPQHNVLLACDRERTAWIALPQEIRTESTLDASLISALRAMTPLVQKDYIRMEYGPSGWVKLSSDPIAVFVAVLAGKYPQAAIKSAKAFSEMADGTTVVFSKSVVLPTLRLAVQYAHAAKKENAPIVEVSINQSGIHFTITTWAGGVDDQFAVECIDGPDAMTTLCAQSLLQVVDTAPGELVRLQVWEPFQPVYFSVEGTEWGAIQTPLVSPEDAERWRESQRMNVEEIDDGADF